MTCTITHLATRKKYTEEDIAYAVVCCVESWSIDTIISYAAEKIYAEYMDESCPASHIDDLMEEFGNGNNN